MSLSATPRQTDRRTYKVQRSERGLVVLAFDRESKKLAWSSEIELPRHYKPVAHQQFLLHTGGGIVTIAVVNGDKSLKIQELDAETGKVTGECQLVGRPKEKSSDEGQSLQLEKDVKAAVEWADKLLERTKRSDIDKKVSDEEQRLLLEKEIKAAVEQFEE